MDKSTLVSVLATADLLLKRNAKELYQAAKEYKRAELLCTLVKGDAWLNKKCAYLSEG